MSQTSTAAGDQGKPTKMAGDNGTAEAKLAKGENIDLKIKKNSDGEFSFKIVLSKNGLSLFLAGALMLVVYGCKIIGRNQVSALSLAIIICTIYLIYDFAASEDGKEKIRKSMERFEKEFFPNQSKTEPSSDESEPKESQEEVLSKLVKEFKDLNSMTKEYRGDLSKLLEAEREKSKWLTENLNMVSKDFMSERLACKQLRDQESVYKKELEQARKLQEEVKKLKEEVKVLNEEVQELEDQNEGINEALDTERVKNKELKEKAEKSKEEMEKKDVMVKLMQGELEKHKNLEELKEDVSRVLKGEIAQLRRVRGEEERMEVSKLEKKLDEVEAEKAELIKKVATLEEESEGLDYLYDIDEKIESLRDEFNIDEKIESLRDEFNIDEKIESLRDEFNIDEKIESLRDELNNIDEKIESLRDEFSEQVVEEREKIAMLLEDHHETLYKLIVETNKAQSEQAETSSNDDEGYEVVKRNLSDRSPADST